MCAPQLDLDAVTPNLVRDESRERDLTIHLHRVRHQPLLDPGLAGRAPSQDEGIEEARQVLFGAPRKRFEHQTRRNGISSRPGSNQRRHQGRAAQALSSVQPAERTLRVVTTPPLDQQGQLDRPESPVRLRLNSTAVNAINVDGGVEVSYVEREQEAERGVEGGKAYTVRGRHCIPACYNDIIPHLCPELPESQKEHLKYGVKIPLVMANVLLRSGVAVNASGPAQHFCPGSFYASVAKAPPVSLGDYRDRSHGSEPIVLWMAHAPAPRSNGTQSARDLYRLGRHRIYGTPFATYETEIKKQLAAMFRPKGFDVERDIEAITVNRWPHGYTDDYMDRYDPEWEGGKAPNELGRAPIGRIHIANCDSEASAYLHAAIDAAWRAVGEIVV